MPKRHYHVGHNITGYIPDSDPYVVSSHRAAVSASYQDARDHVSDDDYYSATPEERRLYNISKPTMAGCDGDYWVDDGRSLDTHYWISGPCMCEEGSEELDRD